MHVCVHVCVWRNGEREGLQLSILAGSIIQDKTNFDTCSLHLVDTRAMATTYGNDDLMNGSNTEFCANA